MSITLALILITVIVSLWSWRDESMMDNWILNPYKTVKKKQYYRLLTSGFLHADLGHLFFNMFSFYIFGNQIEQVFAALFGGSAPVYLLVFYLLAIVVSDIPTLIRYRNDSRYNSLGASGGVSAIIFGSILFFPLGDICLYFALCMPAFIFGLLYLGYSFWASRRGVGYVNHDAHAYGALFGILFMIVVYPPVLSSFSQQVYNWIF
ncbi:rhomboid family intramembrane serine protease [Arsenicibacter rosenii]|uniref:Rhomboid family intramembrane serine protease n=1 Tax=Arsenicibacter rosenii TaxID=1750698 RepID=A0A1S2VGG6_9BACT|nr:rhomboid family intramembrane serine protease [Arsenicibacter rosenii]OIN57857.1 rhomboid family intramembrane serine protease [Arsenicibacter rosenii]